ncbi:MAG: hypothetical protein ABSG35_23845 [Syntrophobacteraceae bacterium]
MSSRAETLVPLRLAAGNAHPRLKWTEGMSFKLPLGVLTSTGLIIRLDKTGFLSVPEELPPIAAEAVEGLRLRAAFIEQKRVNSGLLFSYRLAPPRIRSLAASLIGTFKRCSVHRWASFPMWPLDLSADLLSDLAQGPVSPFADGPTPVILTHDLDSKEGLDGLVERFLPIEEGFVARSVNFVVPRAYMIDHRKLDGLVARGCILGIHGYDHSCRTPFCSEADCRARLSAAGELIDIYGIRGYRAPSLLRTPLLLRELAFLYDYDSSIPTSGGLFPVPNNGCASARPFRCQGIVEIPLSMPRDGSLLFLGYSAALILETWFACANAISKSGGVVVLLTHCEKRFSGNSAMLKIYSQFLEFISTSEQFFFATPEEVLRKAFPRTQKSEPEYSNER